MINDIILKNSNDDSINLEFIDDDDEIIDFDDFNNDLINKFKNCKSKLNETKQKIINLKKNDKLYQEKIYISIQKHILIKHIQQKLNKLYQKLRLIDLKNIKYKKCYDIFNISIIILSTGLTILESSKAFIQNDDNIINNFKDYFFNMSGIILSSVITFSASILKFKKYQEKMENICKIIEKGTYTIGGLKKIREDLIFCNNKVCFNMIKKKYKEEVYENYIIINQEIERILKNNDYDKYLEYIYNTDFKIHILNEKRKYFFKNYNIDKNIVKFNINNKKPKNYCC